MSPLTTKTKTLRKTLWWVLIGSFVFSLYFLYFFTKTQSAPPGLVLNWTDSFSERTLSSCFPTTIGNDIVGVYERVSLLQRSRNPDCQSLFKIFDSIFSIERIEAPLVLPELFKTQVGKWLNNDLNLLEKVPNQEVYKVVNKVTGEESIYNPLRSKRPVSKSKIDPMEYSKNIINSSAPDCDFCRYKNHTAYDVFGRIENKLTVSASNTFKLARFHGLFFPRSHNPLNISLETLEELFLSTAKTWFEKAYLTDPSQIYPSLLWDNLPHAGASQVHPHVHGLLDNKQYAGSLEVLNQGAQKYFETNQRSYWSNLALIHRVLDLAIQEKDAIVFTPLSARKDHEFMIYAPAESKSSIELLHRVIRTYMNKLNVYCFSSGASFPPLKSVVGLPFVYRIGSRGDCTTERSDVSSLELYTVNNINSDISATISALRSI